jgi:hypothetical protein
VTILAHHGIDTAGWLALGAWVVGGFLLGLTAGVVQRRDEEEEGAAGLTALGVWVLAPVVAALGVLVGIVWLLDWLVGRTDDAVTRLRPSREQLEQRVAELERELEIER